MMTHNKQTNKIKQTNNKTKKTWPFAAFAAPAARVPCVCVFPGSFPLFSKLGLRYEAFFAGTL